MSCAVIVAMHALACAGVVVIMCRAGICHAVAVVVVLHVSVYVSLVVVQVNRCRTPVAGRIVVPSVRRYPYRVVVRAQVTEDPGP